MELMMSPEALPRQEWWNQWCHQKLYLDKSDETNDVTWSFNETRVMEPMMSPEALLRQEWWNQWCYQKLYRQWDKSDRTNDVTRNFTDSEAWVIEPMMSLEALPTVRQEW